MGTDRLPEDPGRSRWGCGAGVSMGGEGGVEDEEP